MSEIRPFRALRYDPARVALDRVLAPPYDVIAPEERRELYAASPHAAIRLELTREVDEEATTDYSDVCERLAAWEREGILVRDPAPALYGLRQDFDAPDGGRARREGFLALLRLEDYERRVVRPHERTLAAPKADRLKLLRATRANLSPVFLLYEDREDRLARALAAGFEAAPRIAARDPSGARHELARCEDAQLAATARAFLRDRPLVIADGHHRYETALAYRDERRRAAGAGPGDADAPHEWILAYLANAWAPGTLLLPIHRLVRKGSPPTEAAWQERLPGWRHKVVRAADAAAIPALLEAELLPHRGRPAFAADDASGALRVFWREAAETDEIAVRVVHRDVIEGVFGLDPAAVRDGAIEYPKSTLQTARDVRAGRGCVALYLNALAPEDVFRVTAAGEVLPQKSTFFHPKLPTGLVFRRFGEEP